MDRIAPYTKTNTLGKIARKYGCVMATLENIIGNYPALKAIVDAYLKDVKNRGNYTLSPAVVDAIFETLGNP